ncbi:hypothetical protein Tco_0974262 [Tanacetum coccineum]|uniref:Reverse transcriptase domain-containing protein n=1 Tax=Tanacetum coccineum TaxID=301880 RepID=A0ABQ5EB32_9ASTR
MTNNPNQKQHQRDWHTTSPNKETQSVWEQRVCPNDPPMSPPARLGHMAKFVPPRRVKEAFPVGKRRHYQEGPRDCKTKRPKPTPFTTRITHFKYHQRAKLPRNIKVYEGNKDLEDHLGILSAGAEQEEWPMPMWCKMFHQRYAKDPTEVHGIKRRLNKGLQGFMDQFKSESSHIRGVPLMLRISAFMHGHGHLKLAKKLNDKIPKIVDEMFERV